MKIIFLLAITASLLLAACNEFIKKDGVQDFIPGTYTTTWTTEFSEARDTFLIEPLVNDGSETYTITRRTKVMFTTAGKRQPVYKIVRWTGSYNPDAKTIEVMNNGRVLSFDPANKEMKMGTTAYKKL